MCETFVSLYARNHLFNTNGKLTMKLTFLPLTQGRRYAYKRVRNVSFTEAIASVLNE